MSPPLYNFRFNCDAAISARSSQSNLCSRARSYTRASFRRDPISPHPPACLMGIRRDFEAGLTWNVVIAFIAFPLENNALRALLRKILVA